LNLQVGILVLLGVATVVTVAVYVKSTIHGKASNSKIPALIKITLSGIQVTAMASVFSFNWDQFFASFLEIMDAVSSSGTSYLKLDCITNAAIDGSSTSAGAGPAPVYIETLLFALMIFWLILIPTMIMVPYYLIKRTFTVKKLTNMYAIVIPLMAFLLHPTLTKRTMQLMHCTDIYDASYLIKAIDQQCWVGEHLLWFIFMAIPMLLLYVFGIPAIGTYFLYKNKEKLLESHPKHADFNRKYGFLFKGLNVSRKHIFAWESAIYARKVVLLGIAVFFGANAHVQGLLGLGVIFIALLGQVVTMPYASPVHNQAETLSLVTSGIMFFLGQFTYTPSLSDGGAAAISVFAILVNVLFLTCMAGLMLKEYRHEKLMKTVEAVHNDNGDTSANPQSIDMDTLDNGPVVIHTSGDSPDFEFKRFAPEDSTSEHRIYSEELSQKRDSRTSSATVLPGAIDPDDGSRDPGEKYRQT
jgi:hypothetical protein